MISVTLEMDAALQRLDPQKATQLERLLRDSLALALCDDPDSAPTTYQGRPIGKNSSPVAPPRDLHSRPEFERHRLRKQR